MIGSRALSKSVDHSDRYPYVPFSVLIYFTFYNISMNDLIVTNCVIRRCKSCSIDSGKS